MNWLCLPNNKLFTVFNYLFNENQKKEIESYQELEEWAVKAETNPEYARKCAVYCVRDAVLGFKIGERSLENMLVLSYLFRENPDVVVTTAKDELALKIHERQQFDRTNTHGYRTVESKEKLEEFSIGEEKTRLLNLGKSSRGTFNASIVYFMPFIQGLTQIIDADKIAHATNRKLMNTSAVNDKIILVQGLEAYLRKALFDLKVRIPGEESEKFKSGMDHSVNYKEDYTYGKIHGIKNGRYHDSHNIQTLNNMIFESVREINKFLEDKILINHSDKFALLEGDVNTGGLESLIIKLGNGSSLSLEKGRFAINVNNQLISQGIDLGSTKGDTTFIQHEIRSDILDLILNNKPKSQIIDYLIKRVNSFEDEDREKFLYLKENVLRDFLDYSDKAHVREKIQNLIYYGKFAGDIFNGGYVDGQIHLMQVPDFLDSKHKIDYRRYIGNLFGVKNSRSRMLASGSIGNILYSALCFDNGSLNMQKKEALSRIIDKRINSDDVNLLISYQPFLL